MAGGPGGFGGGFGGEGELGSGVESSLEVALEVLLRFLFRTTVFSSVGGVLSSLKSDWECGGRSCGVTIPTRAGSLMVTGLAVMSGP